MKQKMFCILVIVMLLFTSIVSLSAVAEKKELNTEPQKASYAISISGGLSTKVRVSNIDNESDIACHFEVWRYYNKEGYETKVKDEWSNKTVVPGDSLVVNYKGYYLQGLNGRTEVKIYINDVLARKSYGTYFFIFIWGFPFHH